MEQFEWVLKWVEGYEYETIKSENGDLIIRLVSINSNAPCSQKHDVTKAPEVKQMAETTDKYKYFTKITEKDREKVKMWLKCWKGKTDREKRFLERANQAIQKVNYDYWIATIEPSVAKGKIYYAEGKHVGVEFSCKQLEKLAKNYALDRSSRLANLYELFIWYALRIVDGLWTLDYVANNSSSSGNYRNAPTATRSMEKTGARECGGYRDGQGNSYKIVTVEDGYALVGDHYGNGGDDFPVADVGYDGNPNVNRKYGSGVLVLTK